MSELPPLKHAKNEYDMADISESRYTNVLGTDQYFENVDLSGTKIVNANMSNFSIQDANLSNLEINGAQLGGATIRHIGMPDKDHPNHEPGVEQRAVSFEECYFKGSTISKSNLENVSISDCELDGMTINGVSVEELFRVYKQSQES